MDIIIAFGKPGAGKGTLIKKVLNEKPRWTTLSTGDIIRKAIKEETELGKNAKSYADSGDLVPDELVVGLVEEAVNNLKTQSLEGVFLDGFPRTENQAKKMVELGIIPAKVLVLDVSDETVIQRLSKRIVCGNCGATFSLGAYNHPKKEGICDNCGSKLTQREDDKPEVVRKRLQEYELKTAPVEECLRKMGNPVQIVSSETSVEEII